ncbi:MAG: hypothetical protein ACLS36_01670 [Streptococcus sp.]
MSETAHDKKDDNSVSNTDQGTVASDSITTQLQRLQAQVPQQPHQKYQKVQ